MGFKDVRDLANGDVMVVSDTTTKPVFDAYEIAPHTYRIDFTDGTYTSGLRSTDAVLVVERHHG